MSFIGSAVGETNPIKQGIIKFLSFFSPEPKDSSITILRSKKKP